MIAAVGQWSGARQETIDLECVGYPDVGDALLLDPGCALTVVGPGMWTNVSDGYHSHLVAEPMTSITLSCPEDGHQHGLVRIVRVIPESG